MLSSTLKSLVILNPQLNKSSTIATPTSSDIFPITTPSSVHQLVQMLHLMEPQLTSSYRQAFIPYYQRPVVPMLNRPMPIITSSRRKSSVLSIRRNGSRISQINVSATQDRQTRLCLPTVSRQQRLRNTSTLTKSISKENRLSSEFNRIESINPLK